MHDHDSRYNMLCLFTWPGSQTNLQSSTVKNWNPALELSHKCFWSKRYQKHPWWAPKTTC